MKRDLNLNKSLFIFAANWTGGSSLYKLVQELCEGEYVVANPELIAWSGGKGLSRASEILPYTPHNMVYYFRNLKPFHEFIEKNSIEPGQHRLLVQIRDPADLLTAEFYGNTLSHIPQPGFEKKWNKIRNKMIRDGVDQYVLIKAEALNQQFEWLHSLSPAGENLFQLETLSYHSFIYRFDEYVAKLVDQLAIEPETGRLDRIITTHDAFAFIDAEDQSVYARNLQRMNRPEEWPFPGRGEVVLSKKTMQKLRELTPVFQTVFKDSTIQMYEEMEPPAGAVIKSRTRLWLRYMVKIRIKQAALNFLRKLK